MLVNVKGEPGLYLGIPSFLYFPINLRCLPDAFWLPYLLHLGNIEKLSQKGRDLAYSLRLELNEDSPDALWRTFRDYNPLCHSIFTGKI